MELASASYYADIVGVTERGFDLVLQAYSNFDVEGRAILEGLADVCGFVDLYRDLARAEDKKEIKQRTNYFRNVWGCEIPHLEKLSQPEDILSYLEQALIETIPEERTLWKRGLLAELEHDRTRFTALFEVAKERHNKWSSEEVTFLLACILGLQRNKECSRHLIKAKDVGDLWKAMVMKPWRGVPGKELEDFLLLAKPEEVLSTLSGALSQGYSYASYAFGLLNLLNIPGRFKLFLDVLEDEKYEDALAEEACEALRKGGIPASQHIIEHYPQMSPHLRAMTLFVLDSFPTPEVVDFCLEHFEEYMCSDAPFEFVGCLEEIASRHFLPPLLEEWKEGEIKIGRAIKLISQIHNIKDKQVKKVVRDVAKRARRGEDVLEKPISLFPLRCTNCRHTYHYELEKIYMGEHGSPIIGDIIQCKGCGSIETYEMTADAHLSITAELVRVLALREAQGKEVSDSSDTPLVLDEVIREVRTLGKKVKSVSEAYHLLKGEIEKHPQEAELQKRMGNVLRNGGRPDLALPYYLEAVHLDPNDTESNHCIADILIDREQYKEAIPYLERLVPLCREAKIDEGLRRDIFSALLHQVYIIQKKTGHKIELFQLAKTEDLSEAKEPITVDIRSLALSDSKDFEFLYYVFRHGRVPKAGVKADATIEATPSRELMHGAPITRRPKKIGRNDPCPCGSGKKYKNCCGR
jgi:tetratricopeptide (TPR) repeat protein